MKKSELADIQDTIRNCIQCLEYTANDLSKWSAKFAIAENEKAEKAMRVNSKTIAKWSLKLESLCERLESQHKKSKSKK